MYRRRDRARVLRLRESKGSYTKYKILKKSSLSLLKIIRNFQLLGAGVYTPTFAAPVLHEVLSIGSLDFFDSLLLASSLVGYAELESN